MGYKWCHGALVVVPDPHGMVFKLTRNISKVFEKIYEPLMGWWIHHHATSSIFVCLKFRELAGFLSHTWATSDVMVHWLRPQTHMEWVSCPLKTYPRCFQTFIFYKLVDGSTIMPYPPCLFGSNLRSGVEFLGHTWATYVWCHGALAEAPDPHGMVFTPNQNISKV